MLVFSTAKECRNWANGPITATIGNFDGVHVGHQALVRHTALRAQDTASRSLVITFDPHPARVVCEHAPLALGSTAQRLEGMEEQGVEAVLVLPFTRNFAALSAADFFCHTLVETLGVRELFVGYDFKMGRDHADAEALVELGRLLGMGVTRMGAILHGGEPVSSTRIRQALDQGDLETATVMLGRPHAVRATVIHGAGRGGPLLGFPTANMDVHGLVMPPPAVYATTARVVEAGPKCASAKAAPLPSVTSFGRNPTFEGARLTLETFILDFSEDLYGKTLEVAFWRRLRGEQKFSGPADLVAQLHADVATRRTMRDRADASKCVCPAMWDWKHEI